MPECVEAIPFVVGLGSPGFIALPWQELKEQGVGTLFCLRYLSLTLWMVLNEPLRVVVVVPGSLGMVEI